MASHCHFDHSYPQPLAPRPPWLRLNIASRPACSPDLLRLDEAAAALDPATESMVLASVDQLASRRTTTITVIAHRLATAAGRIVVLDGEPNERTRNTRSSDLAVTSMGHARHGLRRVTLTDAG